MLLDFTVKPRSVNYKYDWFAKYRYESQGKIIGNVRWNDAKDKCPNLQHFETLVHFLILFRLDDIIRIGGPVKLDEPAIHWLKTAWDLFEHFCRLLVFLVEDPSIMSDLERIRRKW